MCSKKDTIRETNVLLPQKKCSNFTAKKKKNAIFLFLKAINSTKMSKKVRIPLNEVLNEEKGL